MDSSESVRPKYPRYLYPSDPLEEYGGFRVQASTNIEQVVPSPGQETRTRNEKKLGRKRKLVKKYRRLDEAEDIREMDNVVRLAVPRDKGNLMDDIAWYRNWVPTSLGSYEQSYDEMRRTRRRLDPGNPPAKQSYKQEPWRPVPRHDQVTRRHDQQVTGEGSRRHKNNELKPMAGNLITPKRKSPRERQTKGKGRRNKLSRKQFGDKRRESHVDVRLKAGVKPPLPPLPPPPVTPLLDHMEAPGVRPMTNDEKNTKLTNSQREPSIEQNFQSENFHGDDHGEIKTNNHETSANEAYNEENFDLNIEDQQFLVNPVVTYDETEMVKEIENSMQLDRLPGVGQIVTNDVSDPGASPLLPTRLPRRLTPRPRAPVTSSPPPPSPWSPAPVRDSLNAKEGPRFSPTPLSPLTSGPNHENKRKQLGSKYSTDIFNENIYESSLKRRQAFLGPQIPIMKSKMDFNKEGSYNFE